MSNSNQNKQELRHLVDNAHHCLNQLLKTDDFDEQVIYYETLEDIIEYIYRNIRPSSFKDRKEEIKMYFQTKAHEERFNEVKNTYGYNLGNEQKAFVYLATSDILREAKLINVKEGCLLSNSNYNPSHLSTSQLRLTKFALNLFNSANDCDTMADVIDCLDMNNRRMLVEAISIRAEV